MTTIWGLRLNNFPLFFKPVFQQIVLSLMFAVCIMLLRIYKEFYIQHGTTHAVT